MGYQFKIQLMGVNKPPVWRQLQVSESITFDQFHQLIQVSFGWDDSHLYQFSPAGYGSSPVIAISSKEDMEKPDMNALKTKLSKVFNTEKQTFNYIYDFGDSWEHQIVLQKLVPEPLNGPLCLAGKGCCPPEDCGGSWAYEDLKIILADPSHEEYQDMKDWLGMDVDENWDADDFDLEKVNESLKHFK